MRYFVLDAQGGRYGPADIGLLNQWAAQGRILPGTVLVNEATGMQVRAQDLPALLLLPAPPGQPGPGLGPMHGPVYGAPLPGSLQDPGFGPGGPFSQVPQPGMGGPFSNVSDGSKDVNASFALSGVSAVLCGCIPGLPVVTGIAAILAARSASQRGHPSASTAMIFAVLVTGCAVVVSLVLGSFFKGLF